MSIDILDYHAGDENQLQDPTATHEEVEKAFMNTLAKIITFAEEALQSGAESVDSDEFYLKRGDFLDAIADPQFHDWITHMRLVQRAPFRRFPVRDEPEQEDADSA